MNKTKQSRYEAGIKLFKDLQEKADRVGGRVFYDGDILPNPFFRVNHYGELNVLDDIDSYTTWIQEPDSSFWCDCVEQTKTEFKQQVKESFKIWKEVK